MIYGKIENDKFECFSDNKIINNNDITLVIDGIADSKYYNYVINEYRRNKEDLINNIKDFISVYLYDKKKKILLIINDRIGAKKVYYCQNKAGFYFGNSLDHVVNKKIIDKKTMSMFFRYHFIPEPYTIYEDTYKLKHGNYLLFDGSINIKEYWNVYKIFNSRKIKGKYKELETGLNEKLFSTVKKYYSNNYKTGIYLSSGVDSSLVSSLCNKVSKTKINTYSMGFEISKNDETKLSKKIANYLNTNHHEYIIKNDESLKCVKKIPYYYDEPFGDESAVPTIMLNEYAKKSNVECAFTGDGADQLFCGMDLYNLFIKIKFKSIFFPFRFHLGKKISKNKKLFFLFNKVPKEYKAQIDVLYKEQFLDSLFEDNGPKYFDHESLIKTNNYQEKRMILDLNTFTAERVFPKMCIAANKNEIEIISPYLTHELIEYSFCIPHKFKYHHGMKKYILRNILYQYIPENLFHKDKKGFGIPKKIWLKNELNKDLNRLSSKSFIKKQNIFNYDKVQEIINNIDKYTNIVWDYYMFQLWYEKNIM